jgi:hypothetical protein
MVGEDRRAVGRAHARDVGQVLDRDGKTGEPPCFAFSFATLAGHQRLGMIARAVEAERWHGVHGGLDLRHAPGGSLDQIERADLPFLETRHRLDRGQLPELAHPIHPFPANHLCRT